MRHLPVGKISPKVLERTVFHHLGSSRKDVIVPPSEGEDASIIRIGNKFLAMHCDPISGAYSNIGWIAVNIATNDIATRGVRPCWVLSCIMLPQGSSEIVLNNISTQMGKAAEKLGVSIVGGHSEITVGLNHPLVIVSSFGIVKAGRYVTTRGALPGNKIILTKSVGIEGTAIIASDMYKSFIDKFGTEFVDKAKGYLDRLSVLQEALIAFSYGGVLAMHDPTEGGIAGGLNEMANASKTGFRVYENKIPISYETSEICHFFNIDPLRLISSGALLIAARPEKADRIVNRLRKENIPASIIGDVLEDVKRRTILRQNGVEKGLPMPKYDELWKVLTQR
ncbi:MAG: AIR synthase family protein [Candidatus Bathyarchaeota archaeon]